MSAANVVVPLELHQNVLKWSDGDVEMFLMANMKKYKLIDTDIQGVTKQRVNGRSLVRLRDEQLKRWGLLPGPAEHILMLVEELKTTKGLAPGK
jgi:hypothetical protein